MTCELVRRNLAQYIEEEAENAREAHENFPLIFHHLFLEICINCREQYDLTQILIEEHKKGNLDDPPRLKR